MKKYNLDDIKSEGYNMQFLKLNNIIPENLITAK
jgi:hypothetical protein